MLKNKYKITELLNLAFSKKFELTHKFYSGCNSDLKGLLTNMNEFNQIHINNIKG